MLRRWCPSAVYTIFLSFQMILILTQIERFLRLHEAKEEFSPSLDDFPSIFVVYITDAERNGNGTHWW